jgi:hypothetical protein
VEAVSGRMFGTEKQIVLRSLVRVIRRQIKEKVLQHNTFRVLSVSTSQKDAYVLRTVVYLFISVPII